MQNKARKNYIIYVLMLLLFGGLIYVAIEEGDRFSHHAANTLNMVQEGPFAMFLQFMQDNLHHPLTTLLIQIIAVLLMVRLFGYLFSLIGQPGVIGEIVAGIVLGPSVLGLFFPEAFHFLFPVHSLTNLELLSQVGLILFMFVIGMELDFSVLKNKINETLVISHAGILVPFFLGILSSYWIYETYAADHTPFLPFALFIGISMSITAFPVLARIIQERNMTKTPLGTLAIASAANDDVTAWCLLAVVIAISKAGSFASALYSVGLAVVYIAVMFLVVRPFLKKVGEVYANNVCGIYPVDSYHFFLPDRDYRYSCFVRSFYGGGGDALESGFPQGDDGKGGRYFFGLFPAVVLCVYGVAYGDRADQQSGTVDGVFAVGDSGYRRQTWRLCHSCPSGG